ncbi:MAG: class I SAM-dependent methyltransferase [Deltaproteobacteria bacterium]|nr:class I SAM-dependent methyltransferase [Deltaproteobacteria bacterium]
MHLLERDQVNDQGLILGASAGAENIRSRLAAFEALEPIARSDAFADVGCGRGGYSVELARRCERISLVDIQPANLEAARQALALVPSASPDFHCQPAEKLSLPSQHYDAVFLIEVLDHVRDVAACLAEALRILKPRGRCYLSVPNRLFPFETHPVKVGQLLVTPYLFPFLPWLPFFHRRIATARVFTAAEIKLRAAQVGFRSVKLSYVMPPFERTGFTSMRRLAQLCGNSPLRVFGVSITAVLTK